MIAARNNRFLPCRLPNLGLWLSPIRSSITKVKISNKVTQWNDISGNGRHATQTVDANRMVFGVNTMNGIPIVQSPNNAYMTLNLSFLAGTSYTIYGIMQHGANTSGQLYYWISTDAGGAPYNDRTLHVGYSLPTQARFSQFANDLNVTVPNPGGTENQLWSIVFTSGSSHSAKYISNNTVYTGSNVNGTALISANNGKIGCGFNTLYFWRGDIAEIVAYTAANSPTQEAWIRYYLQSVYGMTIQ